MKHQFAVMTATLSGVDAIPVTVEVDIGPGLPGMYIVGLGDLAVQEARQRVRSALRSCGFKIPDARIVINLAPARLKKGGSGFDLPIAVAILCATGQIESGWTREALIVGELALDGEVRGIMGLMAYAFAAAQSRKALVCAPSHEIELIEEVDHRYLTNLSILAKGNDWQDQRTLPFLESADNVRDELDYADIDGEDIAKRALQIAAAGNLGILLRGVPGSGKTMLARRLPTILPELSLKERYETAIIHSVAGQATETILAGRRPFRAPHHSASAAGLIGGGSPLVPGEVSLAHNGVLFLDEMPEFGIRTLQSLRQPMEDKEVWIVRADSRVRFPASFMLVAAANPCPCGFLGDPEHACTCTDTQISRYNSRIGGPIIDRIDLVVDVWRADPHDVLETGKGICSAQLKEGVVAAREFSSRHPRPTSEAMLLSSCRLSQSDRKLFENLARMHHLSGRGIMRTLEVARTIADLEQSECVEEEHLMEAIAFRVSVGKA